MLAERRTCWQIDDLIERHRMAVLSEEPVKSQYSVCSVCDEFPNSLPGASQPLLGSVSETVIHGGKQRAAPVRIEESSKTCFLSPAPGTQSGAGL